MTPFQPSREDGRSDRMVVYELVANAEPGAHFDFPDLQEALQDGVDNDITMQRIGAAVRAANKTLQKRDRRYLGSVRGRGYRVLRSDEHLPVALERKATAEVQMKRGIDLLRNTRLDELSDTQRNLHVGQLMIMDGLFRAVQASERRHDRHDQMITRMLGAVEEIQDRLQRIEGVGAANP